MQTNGIYIPCGQKQVATEVVRPSGRGFEWNNSLIGCHTGTVITLVEQTDGGTTYLWLDDEGLFAGNPVVNTKAMMVAPRWGQLVGDALLLKSDSEGDEASMNAVEIQYWLDHLNNGIEGY